MTLVERYSVHPIVYALLSNKQCSTYEHMLSLLKEVELELSPEIISSDFELEAINAFKITFPGVTIASFSIW